MHLQRAVLVVVAAVVAGGTLEAKQSVALQRRLDATTRDALTPIFDEARRDSLPVLALERKALEGAAKHRSGEEVVTAVRELATGLRTARGLLREAAPGAELRPGELMAAAEAIGRGVPPAALQSLRRDVVARVALDIPFAVLGELVQRGVPADEAREVIGHLVQSGVPQERIVQIPPRVDVALRVGAPPGQALGSALKGMGISDPPRGPPAQRPGRRP